MIKVTITMPSYNHSPEDAIFLYLKKNAPLVMGLNNIEACIEIKNLEVKQFTGVCTNLNFIVDLTVKNSKAGQIMHKKIMAKLFPIESTFTRTRDSILVSGFQQVLKTCGILTAKKRAEIEMNSLQKLRIAGISAPEVLYADLQKNCLFMEYKEGCIELEKIIHGIRRRKQIRDWEIELLERIGQRMAEININVGITHGDPGYYNWLYNPKTSEIYLIDWELTGRAEPPFDLAGLIYRLGSHLDKDIDESDLFEKMATAVITGYSNIDTSERIIGQFHKYWPYFILIVPSTIFENVFEFRNISKPGLLRFIILHPNLQRYLHPGRLKDSFINRFVFLTIRKFVYIYAYASVHIFGRYPTIRNQKKKKGK
jgi:tRNA A-37 threonylcarbamoyl transferase component Bud32